MSEQEVGERDADVAAGLGPELERVIRARDFTRAARDAQALVAADHGGPDRDLAGGAAGRCLPAAPRDLAADVFEYLPLEPQTEMVGLGTEQLAKILNEMAPDDRTALLEELPAGSPGAPRPAHARGAGGRAQAARLPRGQRRPAHDAGVRRRAAGLTVEQALDHVRRTGKDSETLNDPLRRRRARAGCSTTCRSGSPAARRPETRGRAT